MTRRQAKKVFLTFSLERERRGAYRKRTIRAAMARMRQGCRRGLIQARQRWAGLPPRERRRLVLICNPGPV
jgi:hypothetical protein